MELNIEQIYKQILTEAVQKSKVMDAINNHDLVTIYYDGDETINKGYRTIEPYVFGVTKAGNDAIRAWQTKGASDTPNGDGKDKLKEIPGWRMFRLDRIKNWNTTLQKYNTDKDWMSTNRPKYNPQDRDLKSIYIAFEPSDAPQPEEQPQKSKLGIGSSIKTWADNMKNKFGKFFK